MEAFEDPHNKEMLFASQIIRIPHVFLGRWFVGGNMPLSLTAAVTLAATHGINL